MRMVEYMQKGCNAFLELDVYIDSEIGDDNSITVNGVWLVRPGKDDLDITDWLSPDELDSAKRQVEYNLEYEADKRAAMAEDAAEARMEMIREEQQYALDQAQSHRSIMRDINGSKYQ